MNRMMLVRHTGLELVAVWHPLFAHMSALPPPVSQLTLMDAPDAASVVRLVRLADRGQGADDLVERLDRFFSRFPPDEKIMRRLSLMQQACQGCGDLHEFCVTCVYMVATEVLCHPLPMVPPRHTRRVRSSPSVIHLSSFSRRSISCFF